MTPTTPKTRTLRAPKNPLDFDVEKELTKFVRRLAKNLSTHNSKGLVWSHVSALDMVYDTRSEALWLVHRIEEKIARIKAEEKHNKAKSNHDCSSCFPGAIKEPI